MWYVANHQFQIPKPLRSLEPTQCEGHWSFPVQPRNDFVSHDSDEIWTFGWNLGKWVQKSLEVFVGNVEICPHWTSSFEERGPSTFLSKYLLTLNRQSRPVCTSSSVVVSSREHTWEFPKWLTIHAHLGCLTDWLSRHWKIGNKNLQPPRWIPWKKYQSPVHHGPPFAHPTLRVWPKMLQPRRSGSWEFGETWRLKMMGWMRR